MIKYLLIALTISLSYSCKAKKEVAELPQAETEVIEEAAYVPDLPKTDFEPMGNCFEDWNNRERLILYKDEDRIKKLGQATLGTIYIITQVNKDGLVISALIDDLHTTVKKDMWRNMALELVREYQFEPDPNASEIECGTVRFMLNTR